ncbi:conserved hypothetical protein [Anaeromyxobacter sp. K]|nr:conserved hypothetical protein [Anaeromyxobacter sp. K]
MVIVRRGASPRRLAAVLRWVRALVPAAVLVVDPGAGPLPSRESRWDGDDEVIVIDADDIASGPLSLAAALLRGAQRGG